MQLSVVTSSEGLRGLEHEWDALWARSTGRYYDSFGFCWNAWVHAAEPAGRELYVVTVRQSGGELVLVLPLLLTRQGRLRRLVPLGPGGPDEWVVVAATDRELGPETGRALAVAMRAARPDLVSADVVLTGSPLALALGQGRGAAVLGGDVLPRAVFAPGSTWLDHAATLGRLSGQRAGGDLRRLARHGTVARRIVPADAEEVAPTIDWLLGTKRQWGEATGRNGHWLSSPHYRDFLVAAVQDTSHRARAELGVVEVGGRCVSAIVTGLGHHLATCVISAFDADWSKQRAGTVAWEFSVERAVDAGQDYDFGVGQTPLKEFYSGGQALEVSSVWRPRTPVGYAAIQAARGLRASRRIRQRVQERRAKA